jgi:hypothetical protein
MWVCCADVSESGLRITLDHQVAEAHHADQLVPVHRGEPPHGVPAHEHHRAALRRRAITETADFRQRWR